MRHYTKVTKNLLVDIGGVMLKLEWERVIDNFYKHSNTNNRDEISDWMYNFRDKCDFEGGKLSKTEFLKRFREKTGLNISLRTFLRIYRNFWTANEGVINYLKKLGKTHKIYFLSNTDPFHVPYIFDKYPELKFYDGLAASYKLRAVKPNREFFRKALAKFKLKKEECVFIDDMTPNIEGARKFGLKAIQFKSLPQLKKELNRILIKNYLISL